jgi:hypothetical protein
LWRCFNLDGCLSVNRLNAANMPLWPKYSSQSHLLMPPPDGNSARAHPASGDTSRSACDGPRQAAETARCCLCLDDFSRHGSAEHIRSVLASRSARRQGRDSCRAPCWCARSACAPIRDHPLALAGSSSPPRDREHDQLVLSDPPAPQRLRRGPTRSRVINAGAPSKARKFRTFPARPLPRLTSSLVMSVSSMPRKPLEGSCAEAALLLAWSTSTDLAVCPGNLKHPTAAGSPLRCGTCFVFFAYMPRGP